jgi:hypothetical protein
MMFLDCCSLGTAGTIDYGKAKVIAQLFMHHVIKDDMQSAVSLMEPEFIESAGGVAKAEKGLRGLFNYCGRPIEAILRREDIGFKVYTDGRTKPTRKFYYMGKTTQRERGMCLFAVEVAPSGSGVAVTTVGPLKNTNGGALPDWAR